MKIRIACIIILIVGFTCCHDYKSNGKITGPDWTTEQCSGGYLIIIDNVTYQIASFGDNPNIDIQNQTFPIFVKLDWELISTSCPGWISIQKITKE